ncbi:MAG: MFS transporter [Gammaproteobacteria bacterium]|nr:MFS transporter [Gammaproteobacteria bacterium]
MNSLNNNPMDRKLVIMSAVFLSAIGAMFYNLLPMFLGVAQDYRELDNQSIGLLSSMFFAGYTLTTSTAFFWIRRVNWKIVTLLALIIGSMALILAGFSRSFTVLMICIFIAGGAFSTVYGIGATALGDTGNPARWFGLKISAEAMLGAVLLFLLPGTLISSFGFKGMMIGMVVAVLVLAPVLSWLPETGHTGHEQEDGGADIAPGLQVAIWIALFAVTVFLFSATMIWAFVERLASTAGFEPVLVGKVLSLTLVFAVIGSMAAVVIGDRFGSGKPLAAATVLFLLALGLLSGTTTVTDYAIGACLLTTAIGLGITYVITIVADLDMDGRYVVLTVPAIGIGVMTAPAVGGMLTASQDYSTILMVGGGSVILSLAAGLFALARGLPAVREAEKT